MSQYRLGKSVKWKRSRNEQGQWEKGSRVFIILTVEILNWCQWIQNENLDCNIKLIFIKKNWAWSRERQPNLKKSVKIIQKRSLAPIAANRKVLEPNIFYWNMHRIRVGKIGYFKFWFWPFDLGQFFAKNSQNREKVIVFFLERQEDIALWFCDIWIVLWLKLF